MYCVKCGVRLEDSESVCPLCETVVYHPDIKQNDAEPLYLRGKKPNTKANSKVFNEILLMLFAIAAIVCVFSDMRPDGRLNWLGFAIGGIVLAYVTFALPLWFKKRNPAIFIPCDFAAAMIYLHYVNYLVDGDWFLSFAFPITATLALIVCSVAILLHYLKKGKLYVWGGAFAAFGGLVVLVELMLGVTFGIAVTWWSFYSLAVMLIFSGFLFHLAISENARETIKRKLFF